MTNFTLWREYAQKRWDDIRIKQSTVLHPLQSILKTKGYSDVEGSLINANTLDSPDQDPDIYLSKILNYIYICNYRQPQAILEIGFNWGYSASLLLESSPSAHLTSIDIARHWYTPACGEALKQIYQDRFQYTWSDSHSALKALVSKAKKYDLIIVDGGHSFDIARVDIDLSLELLEAGGILIVDDSDGPNVRMAAMASVMHDDRFIELDPKNIGLFPYEFCNYYCYEQLFFMKVV